MQLQNEEKARHSYKPKPYEAALYPGQKVQIDVKFVPSRCVAGETKYYQLGERIIGEKQWICVNIPSSMVLSQGNAPTKKTAGLCYGWGASD